MHAKALTNVHVLLKHLVNVQVQSKNIRFKIQTAIITETTITETAITETTIAVAGEEITITAETTTIAVTIRKKKINHGINSGIDPFNQSR